MKTFLRFDFARTDTDDYKVLIWLYFYQRPINITLYITRNWSIKLPYFKVVHQNHVNENKLEIMPARISWFIVNALFKNGLGNHVHILAIFSSIKNNDGHVVLAIK